MKSRFFCLLVLLAVCLATTPSAHALEDYTPEAIVTDIAIARPACFVVTVFGSVFFVAALPFAAMGGNISQTADAMVARPAAATFTRPVGNFSDLK